MLQDMIAGRQTEVDALNGAVVAAAKTVNVSAPINETLWRMVKLAETVRRLQLNLHLEEET